MKIFKKLLGFVIITIFVNLNFLTFNTLLSKAVTRKRSLDFKNETSEPVDVEILSFDPVSWSATYRTYVKKVDSGKTQKFKLGDFDFIQSINVWKPGANREKPENFIGVLLINNKALEKSKEDENLSCTLKPKPQDETAIYSTDLERLEKGLYNLKCDNSKHTDWLSGTSAGWTKRAH